MASTELTLITGQCYEVAGSPQEVEAALVAAARGSMMELAWVTEVVSGRPLGVNPEHLVTLRASQPSSD